MVEGIAKAIFGAGSLINQSKHLQLLLSKARTRFEAKVLNVDLNM